MQKINCFSYFILQVNCTSTFYESTHATEILQTSESNYSSPFDYLCQIIDNDYIAHPNDCKRYAYCANGKMKDDLKVSYRLFTKSSQFNQDNGCLHRKYWPSIECSVFLGVPQPKLCKKTLMWSQNEKMCVWPAQSDCKSLEQTSLQLSSFEYV